MESILQFFGEFALFGAAIWFWIAVVAFVISLFTFDRQENGVGALFSFIIFSVVVYFWSNFDILGYINWLNIGLYFGVGFIYSLIRTYFLGRKIRSKSTGDIKYIKEKLKGNVFRWWFLWPVSLLNWILSDLVEEVYNFIYSKLKNLYENILMMGVKEEIKE